MRRSHFLEPDKQFVLRLLAGVATLTVFSQSSAYAACDSHAPVSNQVVICSGADTVPIAGAGANTADVEMLANSSLITTPTAIHLGTDALVLLNDNSLVQSAGTAIQLGTGSDLHMTGANSRVIGSGGSAVLMGSGSAIIGESASITGGLTIGGTGSPASLAGTLDSLTFTGEGNLRLISTGNLTGTAAGGATANDILTLAGTTNGTFNTDRIGTTITGFESFAKDDTSTWTLTGTTARNWIAYDGTLVGTLSNLGNVNLSGVTAVVQLDQATDGTYAGVISGGGLFLKTGVGNVTLTGVNIQAGGTQVDGAGSMVTVTNTNALGAAGSLRLTNGGGLQYGTAMTLARNINLNGSGVLATKAGEVSTQSGAISGGGRLIKTGDGVLVLSGINTYSGGTSVTGVGSVIRVNANARLGGVSGGIDLSHGGTLDLSTAFSTARALNLSGGEGIVNTNSGVSIFNGLITGTGTLVKKGGGSMTLGNAGNTYSGGTIVDGSASILRITSDESLGSGNVTLINGGRLQMMTQDFDMTHNIVLASGQGVINNTAINSISGVISGSGMLVLNTGSDLTISGTNTYTGGTSIFGSGIVTLMSDAALGHASGDVTLQNTTFMLGSSFDTARNFTMAAGTTVDVQSFDSVFSGTISGVSAWTKAGTGTLHLTGINNNSAGLTINDGILRGSTDALRGNILNYGIAAFDQSADGVYADVISDTGGVQKLGLGNLILSNTNTYSGATEVKQGRLAVNGSIANSATIVDAAGNLGGSGTVSTIMLNGKLSPGNSIGTLNAGNTTFNNGSIYEVEVNAAGQSDLLAVTGTATINPGATVSVLAAPGSYAANTLYTILNASNPIVGTFSGVTSNYAFLTPTLIHNANNVQLSLALNPQGFASVAQDSVQASVADAAMALGAGNSLYDAFFALTVEQAQRGLDIISGEHFAGLTGAVTEASSAVSGVVSNRLQVLNHGFETGGTAALAPNSGDMMSNYSAAFIEPAAGSDVRNAHNRFWMDVFGAFGRSDKHGPAPAQKRNSAGVIGGVDVPLGENSFAGIFAGFEDGNVKAESQGASSDIGNYHVGLYGLQEFGRGWTLSGGLSGTYHDIDSVRSVVIPGFNATARSDTSGYTANSFVEVAFPTVMRSLAVEPFVGVSLAYSRIQGFDETGAGAANLSVQSSDSLTPSHKLGLRLGKEFAMDDGSSITVNGMVGWNHAYGDLEDRTTMRFETGNVSFDTQGPGRTRDAALIGLGIDTKLQDGLKLYGGYNGAVSPESGDHAFSVGMQWKF